MFPSSATKTTVTQPLTKKASVGFFENGMLTEQENKSIALDPDVILMSNTNFGPESYLTPRRSTIDHALSLDPPSPPRKKIAEKESERIRTDHRIACISIPINELNVGNQTISPLSKQK